MRIKIRSLRPVLILFWVVSTSGPDAPVLGQDQPGPTRTFFTPDACAQCHGVGASRGRPAFGAPGKAPLVRLDEFTTWNERDKHRRAFDGLNGPRGREIGRSLGIADVSRDRTCLSCHGTGFLPDDPPVETSGAMEARTQGVGCTACHGPYLEWVQSHGLAGEPTRKWRQLSTTEKSRRYGLTDLRDPATRAKLCLSCHLGDAAENKVVTHAMYAAGHPPLPGIEVESAARAMPAHWWEPAEVSLFREDAAVRARYRVDLSETHRTRSVLIGGAVALRESSRLLADLAGKSATSWPEYSRFECYSCHHDLKSPGYLQWRQVRGFGDRFDGLVLRGRAGHAQARTWPMALIEPSMRLIEGSSESRPVRDALREGVKDLRTVWNDRPFGEAESVVQAARRLEAAAQGLVLALESTRFDQAVPAQMIASLGSIPDSSFPDYDSARQIAWAIRSIAGEMPSENPRIIEILGDLDRLLKLDPDRSREVRGKLSADPAQPVDRLGARLLDLSEAEYRESLKAAADYDPVAFKKLIARLLEGLTGTELPPLPR